jgi:hypothetical protein
VSYEEPLTSRNESINNQDRLQILPTACCIATLIQQVCEGLMGRDSEVLRWRGTIMF